MRARHPSRTVRTPNVPFGLPVGLVVAGVVAAPPALAVTPPPTAESSSLVVPVLLLESSASAWVLPQESAGLPTGIRSWASESDATGAFGALVRIGPAAFDYRSVPDVESGANLGARFPLTHAGVAGTVGALRFGLAWAWGSRAEKREEVSATSDPHEPVDPIYRGEAHDFERSDSRELTVGIGWRPSGSTAVDVAFGGHRDELEWRRTYESASYSSWFGAFNTDRSRVVLERDGGYRPHALLRVARRTSSGLGLCGVAAWRREEHAATIRRTRESVRSDGTVRDYQDAWREGDRDTGWGVAVGVGRDARARPGWWLHGELDEGTAPWRFSPREGLDRARTRSRTAGAGVAALVPCGSTVELLAGVRLAWTRTTRERRELRLEEIGFGETLTRREARTEEALAAEFGWGIRVRRDAFDLHLRLDPVPRVTDPFASVDLELRL